MRAARNIAVDVMIFLRSMRSVMTPAGRLKISQGIRCAIAMRAISSAFLVTADASHGYAMSATPSPRFATTLAVQSFH